jgi:hypothetical protein
MERQYRNIHFLGIHFLGIRRMYLVAYMIVLIVAFLIARAKTWTDEDAAPPSDKKPGFGPKISLGEARVDFFRNGSSQIITLALVVSIGVRIWIGQWSWWDAGTVLGLVLTWPVQEWLIHKYLEHLPPVKILGRKFELVIMRTHRAHHRNPWDPKFGLTTPHFIIGFVGGVPLLWSLFMPTPLATTGTVATFALILNYEWVHYLIHTSYVPKSWWYRRLWKNHRLHHFQNEHFWYGLTMLTGDRLLFTQPTGQSTPHSTTCMTLGVQEELVDWVDDSN